MEENEYELYAEFIPIWSKIIKTPPEYITLTFEVKKGHSTLMETE